MNDTVRYQGASDILIVDDAPANAQMLSLLFERNGYTTRVALNGKTALEMVRVDPPDLIILDINMPEMDGYEVCKLLKADEKVKGIPVIFISSDSETLDKVNAFKVGGVDYVSKPFQIAEVHARVETHLKIRNLQRELSLQNQNLEAIVRERTSELAETHERLAIMDRTKDEFLNLISHELRTPLNGIFGVSELLLNENDPAQRELIDLFNSSRKNMMAILDDALLLTQIKISGDTFSVRTSPFSLILEEAIATFDAFRPGKIAFEPEFPLGDVELLGDSPLLVKAFSYLLETAAKFSAGEPLVLRCRRTALSVELAISAKGRTIPDELIADFFDVFSVSKPIRAAGELGLGPPVAQRIISLFGGSVILRNDVPAGLSFIVTCRAECRLDKALLEGSAGLSDPRLPGRI
jgi:DNA-binding response OmpR family regulator